MKKSIAGGKIKTGFVGIIMLGALFSFVLTNVPKSANAVCYGCVAGDTQAAGIAVINNHTQARTQLQNDQQQLRQNITQAFNEHRRWITRQFDEHMEWLTGTFFEDHVEPALISFADQMAVVSMHQMLTIGTFFDAKQQLEAQRTLQKLQARAHKDYQPSEDFCWFGTNVRSLAASDSRSQLNTAALSARSMARHLGNANQSSAQTREQDYAGRWKQFQNRYCDPKDNNWQNTSGATGLDLACQGSGGSANRKNRDIDFTRLIDEPRTIDVDFTNNGLSDDGTEEDILALANNLYGHKVLSRRATKNHLGKAQAKRLYLNLRSVAAKRSVAENSFNAIVGLKSSGTSDAATADSTAQFLGAIIRQLGIEDDDVYRLIGTSPSYYAQLEILAKKIYQSPNFYINLYDKPANIARKKVALHAIELMLDRAIYESQIRQEMVMSVLLSSKLRKDFRDVNAGLQSVKN